MKLKATDATMAKGYQQVKDSLRTEITFEQAHNRILAGLHVITEETRNKQGHPIFRYFINDIDEINKRAAGFHMETY